MDYPEISLGIVHNVWTRQMHFKKKGDHETQHTHQFDHVTLLARGSLEVVTNGESTVFTAPHMIFISKDSEHSLTALEDDTVAYCIHSMTPHDGTNEYIKYVDDLVSDDMIPKGIKKSP
jgi:quercetin dioxygenase-like cupin family protein